MVAIVSGNSLGLSAASLATFGQQGTFGTALHGRSNERAFVNVATGNLVLQGRDDGLVGRGADIVALRTYNSQGLLNDDNGDNWSLGLYKRLHDLSGSINTAGSTIKRTDGDGAELVYTYDTGRGLYVNTDGAGSFDTLSYSRATSEWTWTDGSTQVTETYDWDSNSGKLLKITDQDGAVLTYTYAGDLLSVIENASGEKTYLDYVGNNLSQVRVVKDDATTVTRTRYSYDANNRLSAVTVDLTPEDNSIADGKVYTTTYAYHGDSNRVAEIAQTDGTRIGFVYATQADGSVRVTQILQTVAGAVRATNFSYDLANLQTTVTDPLGNSTIYAYDAEGRLIALTGPEVTGGSRQSLQYSYDVEGNLLSQTDANGSVVSYEYDANGNQIFQRDAVGNTISRTYGSKNELLTETVYLVPDPDGDGPQAASQPKTMRFSYDAWNHLRFTVSAEGRVTEYRYDPLGQNIASIVYAGNFYDVTGLAEDASIDEATLEDWVISATVDKTRTLRTDTTYDFRGQVHSVTQYANVDSDGKGIPDGAQSTTLYIYDQAGQLLQTVAPKGVASADDATDHITSYVYDGLGRLLSTTDTNGVVTLRQYDDANRQTIVTLANGLATTSAYNEAGELISLLQADPQDSLGQTEYWYDANGRLRREKNAVGVSRHILYDEVGRKLAEIDGTGSLTEYIYDQNNRLVRTIQYASAVPASVLNSLSDAAGNPTGVTYASFKPAAVGVNDRSVWNFYDDANRLVKVVDELGYVTETKYDGTSRITDVIRYAAAVNANLITLATRADDAAVTPVADAANDRRSRNFYDKDGKLLAILDADGYLRENRYDAAGRLVHTVAYATQADPATWVDGTLSEVRPLGDQIRDIHAWNLYDSQSRLVASVDGEGYLTEFAYDVNGNRTQQTRYANKALLAPAAISSATLIGDLRPAPHAQDRNTTWTYTDLNQIETQIDPENTVTRFAYDNIGNLVRTDKAWNTAEVRTLQARYDSQGRVIGELTAEGSAALAALSSPTQAQVDSIWETYGISHEYDFLGRRISSTDQNNHKTLFYYDDDNRLLYTVNAHGEVVQNDYNSLNQLTQSIRYGTRLSASVMASLTAGAANATLQNAIASLANSAVDSKVSYSYDLRGLLHSTTDELNNVNGVAYNAFGEIVSATNRIDGAATVTTQHVFDRRGQRIQTTEDAGGLNRITQAVYDAFGRITQSIDANGRIAEVVYDRLGRVIQTTDAIDVSRYTTYDAFDRVLTVLDGNGNETVMSYDKVARQMTVTSPEGVTVVTSYNRHGEVIQVRDGRGNTTSYDYDKNGNLKSTVNDALGISQTSSYDRANRLVETVDGNGHKVAYDYDAANRLLTRRVDADGLNLVTQYRYDAKGQQVEVTDANGIVTRLAYDLKGQIASQTVDPGGLNLVTSYSYDARGKTLTVTSPAGSVIKYGYDKLGRRISEQVDPAGLNLTRLYAYDKNDNLISATDANGNVTRYAYDANNRLVYTVDGAGNVRKNTYDSEGRVTRAVSYAAPIDPASLPAAATIDQIDLLVSVSGSDAVENRVYDKDGRVKTIINGMGDVVAFTYDANGNVVERIAYANRIDTGAWMPGTAPTPVPDAADQRVRTVYDALNRATYTIDGVGAVVSQTYDGNGNVIERIAYAGTVPAGTAANDAALGAAVALIADSARDARMRMVYDRANRLTYRADGEGAVTQQVYDKNGNVVKTIAYATAIGATADPRTVAANAAADRVAAMAYDAANRLVYAVNAQGGVSKTVYDRNGNVAQQVAYHATLAAPTAAASYSVASLDGSVSVNPGKDRVAYYAYDRANRQTLAVNPEGAVTEIQYDAAGNAILVRAYANQASTTGLAAVSSEDDIRGRITADAANDRIERRTFDAGSRLIYSVDALGHVTQNRYDGLSQIVGATRFAFAIPATTPNTVAAIAAAIVIDAGKDQTDTFAYDAAGNLTASTDALGNTESFTYDGIGQKLTFTNKRGAVWGYDYDAAGRLIRETAPPVAMTAVMQDANGNLVVDAANSATAALVTSLAYDALGNLLSRTEAMGRPEQRTTFYEYDALGRQVKTIHPPVSIYNAVADNLTVNGASGLAERTELLQTLFSEVTYDIFGNAVANRDVAGNMSYKTYDKLGRVTYDVDAMGYVTGYDRNAWGEVTRLTRYAAATSLTTGGAASLSAGQVEAAVNAAGVDQGANRVLLTEYDRLGRTVKVIEPQSYVYDSSAAAGGQYFIAGKTTQNTYNAFGDLTKVAVLKNPVSNTWAVTNNYYDLRGQQIASVDALGYLTTQFFDAVGNVDSRTEFAAAIAGWDGNAAPATPPAAVASQDDRRTDFAYDQSNRKISETRIGVEYSDSANGTSVRGNLATTYAYDAVGNLTRTTDATGASTYSYYDALGRVLAVAAPTRSSTLDGSALTPLTEFLRDAYGNVVVKIDYARGTSAANEDGYVAAVEDVADRASYAQYNSHGNAVQSTDAGGVSRFSSYDAHGHVAKEWQAVSGNDGNVSTLFKAYQYDKLGQLTHALDPASTTVYQGGLNSSFTSSANVDENGGIFFAGNNTVTLTWSSLVDPSGGLVRVQVDYMSVSTLQHSYDEIGNIVTTTGSPSQAQRQTRDFGAAAVASGATLSWPLADGIDHLTYIRVLQQDDGGNWITKWSGSQAQANSSGMATVSQAQAGLIDTSLEYNAFGEIIRKGINGGDQEYFDYDGAGRLWRTNSGDGADKVMLYDLEGNTTAEIRSAGDGRGNVNLAAYASVTQVAGLADVRRTDTRYDLLGRVTQQFQPERLELQGGVSVSRLYAGATVTQSAPLVNESGSLPATNSVNLTWNSLTSLGSGEIRVVMDYTTLAGSSRSQSRILTSEQGATGMTLSWQDSIGEGGIAVDPGISKVNRLAVYKKDIEGQWQLVIDRSNFGYGGNTIEVAAPADPNNYVQLMMRPAGSTGGWTEYALTDFGDALRLDASSISAGNYEYQVLTTSVTTGTRVTATGTLGLTPPPLSVISTPMSFGVARDLLGYYDEAASMPIYGPVLTGMLAWQTQGASIEQIFRFRPAGSSGAWESRPVVSKGNGYDGVDLSQLTASGAYEYELLWIRAGEGTPYAHATGQINVVDGTPAQYVPAVGLPPIAGVAVGSVATSGTVIGHDEGGNPIYSGGPTVHVMQWPHPGAYTTVSFAYRAAGASSWSTLPVTSIGDGTVNESGYTGGYQYVRLDSLAVGNYEYRLQFTALGSATPTSHALGNLTISPPPAGHYVTQTVPVQVAVTITPVDPSQYITGYTGGAVYGAPVVTGYDNAGNPIFGQGYGRAIIGYDESSQPIYGPVQAIPYTVYHTETQNQTVAVQVAIGQEPVYARDEGGNIIYQPVYETRTGTNTVSYQALVRHDPVYARDESGNIIYTPVYETRTGTRQVAVQVIVGYQPIIGGYDEYGNPIVIGHQPIYQTQYVTESYTYQALVRHDPVYARDEGGNIIYTPVYETRYRNETYTYQVQTGSTPVYQRDENGNIVYNTIYETQYQTVQVQVQVPTTVTPPDPSNYIISNHSGDPIYGAPVVLGHDESGNPIFGQGYGLVNGVVAAIPYTVMQTQYQDQQVWVQGAAPAPTIVNTTPAYQAAYTIAAVPTQYSAINTTAAGSAAISLDASSAGAVLTQGVGLNGDARWIRPVINQTVDRWGNVLSITDPRADYWKTTYRYNANNQLIEEVKPDSNGNLSGDSPTTRVYYDRLGQQVAVRDANNHVNGQVYDQGGHLVQERHADGGVIRHVYNAFGDRVQTTDAMDKVTRFDYDKLSRMTQITRGIVNVYTVSGANTLQGQGSRAITETMGYDQAGRKLWSTNGNYETIRYSYDLLGNVTSTTQHLGQVTRAAWDTQGRKIAEVDANGFANTWTYDYFGQLQGHSDLGGARYYYIYDNARQLRQQWNTRGQSQHFAYDAAGQLTSITDTGTGTITRYAYDLAGNRILEKTIKDGVVYQDNHLAYDAVGRLRDVSDGRAHISMEYDKVGNRTRVQTHVINAGGQVHDSDRWFAYDEMNRQTVVDGVDAAGNINAAQGHRITYDLNGNRTSDTSWRNRVTMSGGMPIYMYTESGQPVDEYGNVVPPVPVQVGTTPITYSASQGFSTEVYGYDALNRLTNTARDGTMIDARYYDGASRVVQTGPNGTLSQAYVAALNGTTSDGSPIGNGSETRINRFDGNGKLLHQRVLNSDNTAKFDIAYSSYDDAGNLLAYSLSNHEDESYTNTYTYTLNRYEGYKEGTVSGASTKFLPGTTTNLYDVNGNLTGVVDSTKGENNRSFINDIGGRALYVNQNGRVQRQMIVNGEVLGRYGSVISETNPRDSNGNPSFVDHADFNFSYRPIDGNYPTASPGVYMVAAGDTLESIARGAYGDSALWYLIADANGLFSNRDLKVGQALTIPSAAGTVHNNGTTFKPYDPSKVIGDTTPNLPVPKQDDGCGGIGKILVVIIAVVVTFVLQQYHLTPQLFGGGLLGTVASGAASAAVGSLASQAFGNMIGVQDGIDWKGVALAAIGNGITSGMPGFDLPGGQIVNVAVKAAVTNAMTQGIAVVTGLQEKFDWKGVAASAVGAGVGAAVAGAVGSSLKNVNIGNFSKQLIVGSISGFAGGLTTAALKGGRISAQQVAIDAFGNALGNSIASTNWSGDGQPSEQLTQAQQDAYHPATDPDNMARAQRFLARNPMATNDIVDPLQPRIVSDFVGLADLQQDSYKVPISNGTPISGSPVAADQATLPTIVVRASRTDLDAPATMSWEYRSYSHLLSHGGNGSINPYATGSATAIGPVRSFFLFKSTGRFLSGAGTGSVDILKGVANLGKEAYLTVDDAIGQGLAQVDKTMGLGDGSYQRRSALGNAIENQGLAMTGLNMIGGVAQGLFQPLKAVYRRDPQMIGENLPGAILTAVPLARAGGMGGRVGVISSAEKIGANHIGFGGRASRITFETDGFNPNGLDPISLKNFGDFVSENPIANAAMKQVQRVQEVNGGPVRLQFGEGPSRLAGEVGKTSNGAIEMDLYMLNTQNSTARGAAATFVHESSHYTRASRGFEIGTQLDEYRAFRRELFFDLGRRPTILEKQNMWMDKVQNNSYYSNVPLGGSLPKILKGPGG